MIKKRKTKELNSDNPKAQYCNRIFQPFRAIGYVTNDIPFDLQALGHAYFLTACVGNSFHVYDCSKLTLKIVGSLTEKPITALASFKENTFVACSQDIIMFNRGKVSMQFKKKCKGTIFSLTLLGIHLIALKLESVIQFDENFVISTLIHPSTYLNKILLGSKQGTMQIWNIHKNKLVYSFASFESPITYLIQSPVVDVIAVGLLNGMIKLYNIRADELIISFKQEEQVTAISFRTGESKAFLLYLVVRHYMLTKILLLNLKDYQHFMATANMCGDIFLWDLDNKRLSHVMKGAHDGLIPSIKFLNGQPLLITSGSDNSIKQWIFDEIEGIIPRLLKSRSGHHAPPTKIQYYDSRGQFILSAGSDKSLRTFSIQRDEQSVELSQGSLLKKSKQQKTNIDNLKLPQIIDFSACEAKQKEWDHIITCHINHPKAYTWSFQNKVSTISSCGNFGFIGTAAAKIEMFNMQSGISRRKFEGMEGHTKSITGLSCDLLNRILLSSSLDGSVKIWDFNTAKILDTIDVQSPITLLRFHKKNELLAISSDDLCIRVIDIDTHKIVREFWGHRNRITDLTFSPDGRWIVSTSLDATIRTWDLPTGHLIDIFRVNDIATSLTFSPSGDFLATSHVNNVGIFLWANRTMFQNVTLNKVNDEMEQVDNYFTPLPTTAGIDSEEEDTDINHNTTLATKESFETPEQITQNMITLSSLPKSKWQNLLNLETIKKHNKPKEPPKKPEKAPFFLPTLPGVEPKFVITPNSNEALFKEAKSNGKLIKSSDIKVETEFVLTLKRCHELRDYTNFFNHIKTLNPSAIDFELRSLTMVVEWN
ncbi:9830_t:CDS:10 [Entrophospora sp. SA101]|nr:9830_t:CDS:10 [Entrophospora sp. SA101]